MARSPTTTGWPCTTRAWTTRDIAYIGFSVGGMAEYVAGKSGRKILRRATPMSLRMDIHV